MVATKDDSMDYQSKQVILLRSVNSEIITFLNRGMFCRMHYCLLVFLVFVNFLLLYFSCHVRNLPKQVRKAMGAVWMYQMRELLHTRAGACIVISICINEGYRLYSTTLFFGCFTMSTVLFTLRFELRDYISW